MTQTNANRLRRIRKLLGLLAAELLALGKSTLLPWAESCWHSTQDFVQLTVTGDNFDRLWQGIFGALMRLERWLESPLPESWRNRRPIKTILLLALLLLLVYLASGDGSVEDLKRSGEAQKLP
ncbi:MAG TPA: hypothetical protein VKB27_08360 [Gammaproteobacteria bacterium]|nr:hypothetical protein [Gammaproteobacteria bacterium]